MNADPTQPADQAAIYCIPEGAFDRKLPSVPPRIFTEERNRAFDPATPTCTIPLDIASTLELGLPATTPALLMRYLVIRPGEELHIEAVASGQVCYVLQGSGIARQGGREIAWGEGDIFCFPSELPLHVSARSHAILLHCTDEPLLAYIGAVPAARRVQPAHFPAETIAAKLDEVHGIADWPAAGRYVNFTTPPMQRMRAMLPGLILGMNTLEPGLSQRPHLHNAVAVTLALDCEGVYSTLEGARIPWQPGLVFVTPPRARHNHTNTGPRMMRALVFQDGGLFYHLRVPGFSYVEQA